MSPHAQHFASVVAAHRRRLGLTLLEVNRNGGPTAPTLAKAEAGALEDPRPSTLAKFDTGLHWTSGSAARIYWDGGQPRTRHPVAGSDGTEWATPHAHVPADRLIELVAVLAHVSDLLATPEAGVLATSDVGSAVCQLDEHVRMVVGLVISDLLRRIDVRPPASESPIDEIVTDRELLDLPDDIAAGFSPTFRQCSREGPVPPPMGV